MRRNDSMNKDKKTIEIDKKNNEDFQNNNQNRIQENPINTLGNIYDPNHLNYLQSKFYVEFFIFSWNLCLTFSKKFELKFDNNF